MCFSMMKLTEARSWVGEKNKANYRDVYHQEKETSILESVHFRT